MKRISPDHMHPEKTMGSHVHGGGCGAKHKLPLLPSNSKPAVKCCASLGCGASKDKHAVNNHHPGHGCCASKAEETKLSKLVTSLFSRVGILQFADALEHNTAAVIASTVALILSGIIRYLACLENHHHIMGLFNAPFKPVAVFFCTRIIHPGKAPSLGL